ncbi:MAG: hypothetical protein GXO50_09355 [Chlorobi bacterium]|nr:hypothetical protein [Chlorobiota bacterium]
MSKPKKFGAFAGVFTPSVLTILGVIMYMRLGWVTGNAGLFTALIIIIISHVISVTTGLSISSVATDKKIETGGIYYILSRSLGFPVGGAVGIALFTGTALGISLYLVGFAESLLAVDAFRTFFGLSAGDLNSIRIIATAALILLVTLAFISTSLAIKSQYFIMAAIALSLVSIVAGILTGTEFTATTVSLAPLKNGASLQEIFGVFFPAVTGFTAGVAMSGDLRNPEKDIPRGTLASIAVGFIVYVGLTILFALFVDRNLLINDYNFLLKVSLYAPLVLAGIWGATLSSALGGILGGPRILQAIAKDKILPEIFAKGYGASQEPRNALIFIFLIAEGGILIGSLNAIAEVVSMFYLASYGFINLAFFLESWASTDFRPTFKVKGIVGLIGFIASFLVMAQLGVPSMIAALVIMFGIFAWLNRKQLKSESGDVWQSVWLSIVRKALYALNKKSLEERNWQPNIILFSGGEGKRPHLIEFGKDLVGKYGLLSNFDLYESKDKKYLFPKHLQAVPDHNGTLQGVFTRRQTCSDIYTGIETIISTYGFSGIEPNTVLMGWMRQSKNPVRFSQMIRRINELDVNLLLMDYDKRYGFGKYKTIDIWWRGSGNNGNLALHLTKFLRSSSHWKNAELRLLIGNPDNENAEKIRTHAEQVLNNMRIDAEIKIINNQIEQKPFYELIRTESLETDLIILGLPDIKEGEEEKFVKNTSKLMQDIGTVILIKASSKFKNLNLGFKYIQTPDKQFDFKSVTDTLSKTEKIKLPDNPVLESHIRRLFDKINVFDKAYKEHLSNTFIPSFRFISEITEETELLFNRIADETYSGSDTLKNLNVVSDKLLKTVQTYVRNYNTEVIPEQFELFEETYEFISSEADTVIDDLPDYVFCKYDIKDLTPEETDDSELKLFKQKSRLKIKISKKPVTYKIRYKDIVKQYIPEEIIKSFNETGKKTGVIHIQFIVELQKLIKNARSGILRLQALKKKNELLPEHIEKEHEKIREELARINKIKEDAVKSVYAFVHNKNIAVINKISKQVSEVHPNRYVKKAASVKEIEKLKEQLNLIPRYWKRNEQLFLNAWSLELLFLEFENRMYRIIGKSANSAEELIRQLIINKIDLLKPALIEFLSLYKQNYKAKFDKPELPEITDKNEIAYRLKELLVAGFEKFRYLIDRFPEKIELLTNEALNEITEHQFEDADTVEVSVPSLLDYVIRTELNEPLTKMTDNLPDKISSLEQNVHNILNLILFTLFDNDGQVADNEHNTPEDVLKFINKQIEKLTELRKEAETEIINMHRRVDERLSEVSNHLNIYLLIKNEGEAKSFAKKKDKKQKRSVFGSIFKRRKLKLKSKIFTLFKFKTKTYFNKQNEQAQETISKVKSALDLVLQLSPDSKISADLPYFYRQLFLRDENFNSDFFVNRFRELSELSETVKRYESGYKGGILITGEPYSGKSFLSYYFAGKYLRDRDLYVVKPPLAGSISVKTFDAATDEALQIKGFAFRRFSKIKPGSVILFDAAELWWENKDDGYEIITKLKNLIQEYSDKFLFMVNINIFALKILNKNSDFENYFLNIINCRPFSPADTEDMLLKRHVAGGIPLIYKSREYSRLKPAETEKLFERFTMFSDGNAGIAVSSWIANIKKYSGGHIYIDSPNMPDLSALNLFDEHTNAVLYQFLLHKRLSVKKAVGILNADERIISDNIAFLMRSGIITERAKGIFELNRFVYVPVKHHLKDTFKDSM